MTERIIDISSERVRLSIDLDRLMLTTGNETKAIPLCEVSVLILAHPQVSLTQAVLARLMGTGGALVACDDKREPAGLMLPLHGHHLQSERFRRQAEASLPVRKRLWQQIVQAKIAGQARTLGRLRGDCRGLEELVCRVRSGDPQNVEALAARRYWSALFGPDFRRASQAEQGTNGANVLLNFGYGILRALVGRAICASGLHPALGIHHRNRYDPFPLASDLMEPFRPIIDEAVGRFTDLQGPNAPLDRSAKAALLGPLTGRYPLEGEERSLFDIVSRTAASLAAVFIGETDRLTLLEL